MLLVTAPIPKHLGMVRQKCVHLPLSKSEKNMKIQAVIIFCLFWSRSIAQLAQAVPFLGVHCFMNINVISLAGPVLSSVKVCTHWILITTHCLWRNQMSYVVFLQTSLNVYTGVPVEHEKGAWRGIQDSAERRRNTFQLFCLFQGFPWELLGDVLPPLRGKLLITLLIGWHHGRQVVTRSK